MPLRIFAIVAVCAVTLAAQCPTVPVTVGSTVNAALNPNCPSQFRPGSFVYRAAFSGTAGQQVGIDTTSTLFDPYSYLLDPSGAKIAEDDNGGGANSSRIPSGSGSFRLPSTGQFVIEITSFGPGATGTFTLRLTSPALCPASAISVGQALNGALTASSCISPTRGSSFANRYTFSANAGLQVVVDSTSTTLDSYMFLIKPDGTILVEDDDSGGAPNARIPTTGALTIPAAGTYTIEVASFGVFRTGAYTLRLSSPTGPATPPIVSSLSPFAGSGQQQTFTLTYTDQGGWTDLNNVYVLFNLPNVASGGCYVEFNRAGMSLGSGTRLPALRLVDDSGVAWLGPTVLGSGQPLSNSQCTVNAAASSFSYADDTLMINVALSFAAGFTGKKNVYMLAMDNQGLVSDWLLMGNWWPVPTSGVVVNRYRLYNPFSLSHLHTTDLNEYNVLATRGFTQEGVGSRIFNAPATAGSVTAAPFYRLYSIAGLRHFWTTDRNEYLTLSRFTSQYIGEGADGFIAPSATGNAIPLFRLRFATANPPIHHWTSDAYENSVLSGTGGGWISEGISGYVFPVTGPVVLSAASPAEPAEAQRETMKTRIHERAVGAVVNGASLEEIPLSAGSLVRLYGGGLEAVAGVRFEGVPAQIVSVSPGEIVAIVPEDVRGKNQAMLQVDWPGGGSTQVVRVATLSPAIFATDYAGHGQAQMRNEDGTSNSSSQPASPGSVVTFDMTGIRVEDQVELAVAVGGYPVDIISVDPIDDAPGRIAVRIRVPEQVTSGTATLTVRVGPSHSQRGVTMAVK